MPKLPRISGEKAIRTLKNFGFEAVRQQGSHVVLKKKTVEGEIGCVVPLHRELAVGTLHGILKQAKISVQEFLKEL
jgi:predicted RNA binding protein YcfA (HicA-like mRNA interferase family)